MEGTTIAERRPLVEGFVDQARRTPGATALVWRGHSVDYGSLLARAERERERIAALPAGAPVALPAVKSPRTVALVLACLLARRPLLLPSPALGGDVLQRLYEQAGVGHVLAPGRPPMPRRSPRADLTGTALLLTTSGSTGLPKIVPLSGAALDRFVVWAGDTFGIGPGTTVLNYAPLNFDVCLLDVWTTLARGGRVVLVDAERVTDGGRLLDLVERERPEVVQSGPHCRECRPPGLVRGLIAPPVLALPFSRKRWSRRGDSRRGQPACAETSFLDASALRFRTVPLRHIDDGAPMHEPQFTPHPVTLYRAERLNVQVSNAQPPSVAGHRAARSLPGQLTTGPRP